MTARAARRPHPASSAPLRRLMALLGRARAAGIAEHDAMAIATSGRSGRPAVRMVLLRGIDHRGLSFFTNYASRKGRELPRRPWAAVAFYWAALGRQVRVEGRVRRLSAAESDDYFASRPRGAQLAAWASQQSAPIRGRAVLMARYRRAAARFRGRPVERPPGWGGFLLVPDAFEFWASGARRLHSRLRFARRGRGWRREWLAP